MKKLIALAAAAMMLLSLFSACGKEPVANNDNDTEKTTTFTVGFDAEFPPYGYQDENGEYVGFDLDLAAEVCTRNGWELAGRLAERMLPQVFKAGSPVFELTLPADVQIPLETLLASLPPEVFTASASLG